MPLRSYRFQWQWSRGIAGGSESRVVCAEDAKDAIVLFEHERMQLSTGVPEHYTIAAIELEECPACGRMALVTDERGWRCLRCKGTGERAIPPKDVP